MYGYNDCPRLAPHEVQVDAVHIFEPVFVLYCSSFDDRFVVRLHRWPQSSVARFDDFRLQVGCLL